MKISTRPRPRAYENTDGRPTWSPDSSMVASEKGRDVVVLSRSEKQILNTLGPKGAWVHAPDWSPDGKRITYGVFGKHRDYDHSSWGIYSSAPDGSDAEILQSDGQEPEFNPQGDRIAYQFTKPYHPDRIVVVDADGSNPVFVTKGSHFNEDLSWSPGGHQIAYDGKYNGTYQLRITDITGKKDRKLTDGDGGRHTDKNPEWAPDGKSIMFERHSRFALVNSVLTIDPITKEEKTVVQATHRHLDATWSPDGSKIAFVSDRDNEEYELDVYVMNADGTGLTQVSDMKGQEYAPAWSPDGKALAFNRWDREAEVGSRDDVHIVELPEELWGNREIEEN